MNDKYEKGREVIEELENGYGKEPIGDLNESTTRFYLIDKILIDCLQWERNDIKCEERYSGKYCDYVLSLFRPVAIVEAKKSGTYFELPVGKKSLVQPLKSLYKDNQEIKSAIEQVKSYCQERSIPIGIITNGWQIIAFIANRTDSIPPLEGNAFVVPSIKSFLNHFKEVWNCLSKVGFEEEHLKKKLAGNVELLLPPKLSSSIYQYPGTKNRNEFQTELEIISDLVLEDVSKEEELEKDFLDFCYCKSGALSNYSLVSKAILSSRYNYLFEGEKDGASLEQIMDKKGLSKDLKDLFAGSLSKRPVLLVGDVGVGKSTFIDYLQKIEASEVFENAVSFKIDLGAKATISSDIRMAIIDEIREQLYDVYNIDIEEDDFVRHCYHVDLEKFKKSVKVKRLYETNPEKAAEKEIEHLTFRVNNKVEHLKNALKYICKNQKKQIIVFIDNCDQRSDADQEKAFLVSQEFASSWPMMVFVSIRPETYHRTKQESGALSGYHTKAFTIPPPRIDEVLKKRLEFALKITDGEIPLSVLKTHTNLSSLSSLIKVFLYSIEKNRNLLSFLNNISNQNIRKAIELVKKFFGSGHVDMGKILEIYHKQGNYLIPIHELLRSVIYGDNIHYSPVNSEIINVFEVRHHKPNDYFILMSFIALLDDYSKNSRNQGFISIKETYSYLQGVGYTPEQVDSVLNFAFGKEMFETSQKSDKVDLNDTNSKIRATDLGIYHLRFLLKQFTYIDAIIVDTPIFDSSVREKIREVYKIEERLERALNFKVYLDKVWDESKLNPVHFDWKFYSAELEKDISKIEERVTSNS